MTNLKTLAAALMVSVIMFASLASVAAVHEENPDDRYADIGWHRTLDTDVPDTASTTLEGVVKDDQLTIDEITINHGSGRCTGNLTVVKKS